MANPHLWGLLTQALNDLGDLLLHCARGDLSGLIIGAKAFSAGIKVIGVTTGRRKKGEQTERVRGLVGESMDLLGLGAEVYEDDVIVYDQYAGDGYGFMT